MATIIFTVDKTALGEEVNQTRRQEVRDLLNLLGCNFREGWGNYENRGETCNFIVHNLTDREAWEISQAIVEGYEQESTLILHGLTAYIYDCEEEIFIGKLRIISPEVAIKGGSYIKQFNGHKYSYYVASK